VLPVIAAIGGAMMLGGAVGSAKSGILDRSGTDWAKTYNWQKDMAANRGYQDQYSGLANAYMNRKGPTLGDATMAGAASLGPASKVSTTGPDDAASRGMQSALASKLMGQMNGTEPSLAQLQMQQGLAQSLKQQQAAAAGIRGAGVNASLAMRNLGDQAAAMRQGLVGNAAMARLAEQQGAMSQLGGLSSGMRSQDLATAQMMQQAGMFNAQQGNQFALAQAGFNQQANMANAEAANKYGLAGYQGALQAQGMNDQMVNSMFGARQHANDSAVQSELAGMDMFYKGQDQNYRAAEDAKARRGKFWGGIMGAGASLMQMSDENMKTDVKPAGGIVDAISALGPGVHRTSPGLEPMRPSAPAEEEKSGGGMDMSKMAGMFKGGGMASANSGVSGADVSAMSDERQKAGVSNGDPKLRSFYDALEAHSYRYKDPSAPGAGEGRYVSPMAQELEKSDIGKTMVTDTPEGKMVDYGKGFGAMLAGQAEFHDRLKRVEAALAAKKGKK
jgi:hypothetical protein